ncbi:MAG: tetratricopeptide repeat protein, partial [Phycisphaerales bacterium]|nr:tetratricopeptide repeat protein [Phycisphaerales bacterium]
LIALSGTAPKYEPAYRSLLNSLHVRMNDRSAPVDDRRAAYADTQTFNAKLLKAIPTSTFARLNAAMFVIREGQLMDAEAIVRRLAIENPDDVEILSLLAELRQVLGLTREAVTTLEEPLRKNPNPDLAASLARLYREQKKPDDALALTARLMAEHPESYDYILLHTNELITQQKNDDAATLLSQSTKKFNKFEDVSQTARLWSRLGRPTDGVLLLQSFNPFPDSLPPPTTAAKLYTLSHLQSAAGMDDAAEASLLRVLELMPDHNGANNDLAYFWTNANKNLDRTEKMLEKALHNEPNNSAFLDSLGWLYYKQGHFEKAVELLERAITLPRGVEPEVLQHLADALYRLGKKDEATTRYRQAHDLLQQEATSLSPERRKVKTYLDAILSALDAGQEPKPTPTATEASTTEPRSGGS